jgi:hypothetical protein
MAQVKKGLYHDHYLVDMFLPFVIKVFGYLHQEADNFLHQCGNVAWIAKGTGGPPLSILCSFYNQSVSMTLRRAQVVSISKWAVTAGEGSSGLGVLLGLPPLSLVNMLHASGGKFDS